MTKIIKILTAIDIGIILLFLSQIAFTWASPSHIILDLEINEYLGLMATFSLGMFFYWFLIKLIKTNAFN